MYELLVNYSLGIFKSDVKLWFWLLMAWIKLDMETSDYIA